MWSLGIGQEACGLGLKEEHQYLVPHRSDTDSSTDDPEEGAPLAVSPLELYSGRKFLLFSLFRNYLLTHQGATSPVLCLVCLSLMPVLHAGYGGLLANACVDFAHLHGVKTGPPCWLLY